MVIEEEQGRRSHAAVRIPQHLFDARQDPEVAGRVEKLEGAPAHVGRLVVEQVAHAGVRAGGCCDAPKMSSA